MAVGPNPRFCIEFEVEKIIGVSADGNYQVQWAPAWVSKFHLVGCEHLIQEFLQQQGDNIKQESEVQLQDLQLPVTGTEFDEHGFPEQQSVYDINSEPQLDVLEEMGEINPSKLHLEDFSQDQAEMGISEFEIHLPTEVEDIYCVKPIEIAQNGATDQTSPHSATTPVRMGEIGTCVEMGSQSSVDNTKLISNNQLSEHISESKGSAVQQGNNLDCLKSKRKTQGEHNKKHNNKYSLRGTCSKNSTKDHTGQRDTKLQHICNICNKLFRDKYKLRRHLIVHSGLKSYVCPHCTKSFSRKDNLTVHIRLHSRGHPYSCNQCVYSCANKKNLKKHLQLHK